MAIKAGEMFIALGLKGAVESAKGLENVSKKFEGITWSSILSKAAIMGFVYSLGKLVNLASDTGIELNNFSILTKISTDELQRWAAAGLDFGVTTQDMIGNFKSLQSSMAQMEAGQAPMGYSPMIEEMRQLGQDVDFFKFTRDAQYAMNTLNQWAKISKAPPGRLNEWLKSFGLTENVIAQIKTIDMSKYKAPPELILSKDEIKNAAKVGAELEKTLARWKRMFQKFAIEIAPILTQAFSNVTTILLEMIKNVRSLIKEFPALGTAAKVVAGVLLAAFSPVTAAIGGMVLLLSEWQKSRKGEESLFGPARSKEETEEFKNQGFFETLKNNLGVSAGALKDLGGSIFNFIDKDFKGNVPTSSSTYPMIREPVKSEKQTDVNVNQTINNYGEQPKNKSEVEKHHKEAVKHAYYQMFGTDVIAT